MQGIIEAISTKEVTTRFGKKNTYAIKINDVWYSTAFTKPPAKGSEVSFDEKDTQYGKEVVKNTLKTLKAAEDSGGNSTASSSGGGSGNGYTSPKGKFPVPSADGSRAIIRQNAVTNANSLVDNYYSHRDLSFGGALEDYQKMVIATARYIEEYTTGDADSRAAKDIAVQAVKDRAWQDTMTAAGAEAAMTEYQADD